MVEEFTNTCVSESQQSLFIKLTIYIRKTYQGTEKPLNFKAKYISNLQYISPHAGVFPRMYLEPFLST